MRWGIAGTGTVAALFAEALADAPGAELAAVASRSRARADAFAAAWGARRAHEGYDALARDAAVDVVYVATPSTDHHATATRMLEAGKPVLVEKPFTVDAREAREVVELARRKRLFCMEAMWMRFVPAVRELVERVQRGDVGDARSATIELGHPFAFDPSHRLFDAALGGGALLDLGPYPVSLAVQLFGPPERVQGQASFAANGVDETVSAILAHAGGRQSVVAVSLRTRLSNGAVVAGTDGLAELHEPLYRAESFSIVAASKLALPRGAEGARLGRRLRRVVQRARAVLLAPRRARARTVVRRCRGSGYQYQAIEAMRCLRAGEPESPLMPLEDTLRAMETLDAIRAGWKLP